MDTDNTSLNDKKIVVLEQPAMKDLDAAEVVIVGSD